MQVLDALSNAIGTLLLAWNIVAFGVLAALVLVMVVGYPFYLVMEGIPRCWKRMTNKNM